MLAVAALPTVLILLQPDLGTMLVLCATVFGVLAVSGARRRWLVVLVGGAVAAAVAAVSAGVLKAYQVDRFLAFVDPSLDPRGAGYNVEQARIAIGNGGLLGQGLFEGSQTRAGFVPEQQTDFVFTVAGEELGLLGAGLLIALLCVVIWRALVIARRADDVFGRVCAAGIACWFGFQAFQNIGMCLGHHAGHRRPAAVRLLRRLVAVRRPPRGGTAAEHPPAFRPGDVRLRPGRAAGARRPLSLVPVGGRCQGEAMAAMDLETLYRRAVESWTDRARAVDPDRWDARTPCTDWTVRELVNHVVGEDLWTGPLMNGSTIEEVGDRFDGDLLGDDPVATAVAAAEEAVTAVAGTLSDTGTVHLSYGEESMAEYVRQLVADHLIHGWDLAAATGGDRALDPDLVAEVSGWFAEREDLYRQAGLIGEPAGSYDDPQSDLLSRAGRDPDWSADG